MTVSNTWKMKEYEAGDEKRILDYQNSTMAPEDRRSIDYWKWEYANNPTKIRTICVAEGADKTLAGHYALMPLRMKVGKKTYSGAQSVDTFTHHEYRRLGIFVALANAVYNMAADKGVSVFYGFPSVASYHGFVKKLDWIHVTSIEKMFRPLTVSSFVTSSFGTIRKHGVQPIIALLKNIVFAWKNRWRILSHYSGVTVKRVEKFDQEADELWKKISELDEIRVVKDSTYLNWRYVKKPKNTYAIYQIQWNESLLGYLVVDRKIPRGRYLRKCLLVDLITQTNQDKIRLLLHFASIIAKKLGGDSLTVWSSRGSKPHSILLQDGYSSIGELILIARKNRDEFESRILRDKRRWFIMAGDADIV